MRWHTSEKLHAHTSDACVQAFFASLKSWRTRRKTDPDAHPPRRRRFYFRIEYKSTAMRHTDGQLTLSNGKGHVPLVLDWPWEMPKTVVIHWTGTHGEQTHILNGRLLRSKRQYQNKLKAKLSTMIDVKKKGSRRRKKLIKSKQKQIKRLQHHVNDIERKQSSRLISTLHANGVQTVVIGDVRDIGQDLDVGSKNNQKVHQWSHGSIRHKLTYKAEWLGMDVHLQDEHYTSRTCPMCQHVRKSKGQGRVFRCPKCHWTYHRDGVGAINIRQKYLGSFPVIGDMAPPIGLRFRPHTSVARSEKMYEREAVGLLAQAECHQSVQG